MTTTNRIESKVSASTPATGVRPVITLITGGSSGIGLELARQAAADGSDLILVSRDEPPLKAAAEELGRHVRVDTICSDLSQPGAAEDVYRQVMASGRLVSALINCAGFGDYGLFAASNLSKQEQMIAVNVTALTALTRLFLPTMLERDSGHILNVASVTGFLPGPLMSVYFATKHYVLAFSESLIEELRGSGVRVTVLCPPPVKTGFVETARIASGNYMATTRTTPAEVGRYGYRMMKQGKAIAVYSVRYRFLTSVLVRIVPRVGLRWLLHRLNAQGTSSLA